LKNICKFTIWLAFVLLILSACAVAQPANLTENDDDMPIVLLEEEILDAGSEEGLEECLEEATEDAPEEEPEEVAGEISKNTLPPMEMNKEYALLIQTHNLARAEHSYAFLNKDIQNLAQGKEYFDSFVNKYGKDAKSQVQSITADGRYIVFKEYPNDTDCTIEVYEGLNQIFTNTVDSDSYALSEMDYALPPDDYAAVLTWILRAGYRFSYPVANTMIDIDSTIGSLPREVSDDCAAYLIEERSLAFSLYSYPEHKLVSSFKLPYSEAAEYSEDIVINQLVGKQHILYTIWDTGITYLFDIRSNKSIELGHNIFYPHLSPNGKFLAYTNKFKDSLGVVCIISLESDVAYYYELGNDVYSTIIGWVEEASIIDISK